MSNLKHLLGISGGKDSAALALYLQSNYPELDVEYYTCDTGKELTETYELISRLESALGNHHMENYWHVRYDGSCMVNYRRSDVRSKNRRS